MHTHDAHAPLFLLQVVDDLSAVRTEVGIDERHMHPVGAAFVVLPDELVEGQVVADILEYLSAKRHVALNVDVCRLTLQVLGVIDSTNGLVQLLAAIAAADLDRLAHRHAERFEHESTQIDEVDHLLDAWFIIYTETLRRV